MKITFPCYTYDEWIHVAKSYVQVGVVEKHSANFIKCTIFMQLPSSAAASVWCTASPYHNNSVLEV